MSVSRPLLARCSTCWFLSQAICCATAAFLCPDQAHCPYACLTKVTDLMLVSVVAPSSAAAAAAAATVPLLLPPPLLLPAGTSLENNNVFTVQPNVYFEGMDPNTESASVYADESTMEEAALNPATVTVGIVALGIVAVAGSATAIYYEVGVWHCGSGWWLFEGLAHHARISGREHTCVRTGQRLMVQSIWQSEGGPARNHGDDAHVSVCLCVAPVLPCRASLALLPSGWCWAAWSGCMGSTTSTASRSRTGHDGCIDQGVWGCCGWVGEGVWGGQWVSHCSILCVDWRAASAACGMMRSRHVFRHWWWGVTLGPFFCRRFAGMQARLCKCTSYQCLVCSFGCRRCSRPVSLMRACVYVAVLRATEKRTE